MICVHGTAARCCQTKPNQEESVDGRDSALEFAGRSSYVLSFKDSSVRSRPSGVAQAYLRGRRAVE